jgi:TM2 domain-containing membrane protein YozV
LDPLDLVSEDIQARLRKAHVLEQRGDAAGAEALRKEVVEQHPEHPEAVLILASALEAKGEVKEARDLLAGLIAAGNANVAVERKHAELVLKVAGRDHMVSAALSGDFSSMMNPEGIKRNSGTAAFFSMLLPGFGQFYNGEMIKGIVFAVAAVLLWIGLLSFGIGVKQVTEWFWPSIIGLAVGYLVAILDAAVAAGRSGPAIRPERPVPPVDKPFE